MIPVAIKSMKKKGTRRRVKPDEEEGETKSNSGDALYNHLGWKPSRSFRPQDKYKSTEKSFTAHSSAQNSRSAQTKQENENKSFDANDETHNPDTQGGEIKISG